MAPQKRTAKPKATVKRRSKEKDEELEAILHTAKMKHEQLQARKQQAKQRRLKLKEAEAEAAEAKLTLAKRQRLECYTRHLLKLKCVCESDFNYQRCVFLEIQSFGAAFSRLHLPATST